MNYKNLLLTVIAFAIMHPATAEIRNLKFGDFESWATRTIHESALLGGNDRTLYVIGPKEHIDGNKVYTYGVKTPWTSSNAYAKVTGIVKGSNSVEPEKRGDGFCARLDTKMESVKVLGIVNLEVLVSGSIFLGKTYEPIKDTKDPYGKLEMGIKFTGKPKALILDYKCIISDRNYVMRHPGMGCKKIDGIQDKGEFILYLQKRWEDKDGNIHAKRVGTMRMQMDSTVNEWQNDFRLSVHYGDISNTEYYKDYMKLCKQGPYKAMNSKGEMVAIQEQGWADENETPTHMILFLTSGNQGAFIGTVGNTVWVDNIKLEY